jgi:hypothetical protein
VTESQNTVRECGRTEAVSGVVYPPCAREEDHQEAFCRSANGDLFITVDTRRHP